MEGGLLELYKNFILEANSYLKDGQIFEFHMLLFLTNKFLKIGIKFTQIKICII